MPLMEVPWFVRTVDQYIEIAINVCVWVSVLESVCLSEGLFPVCGVWAGCVDLPECSGQHTAAADSYGSINTQTSLTNHWNK